MEIDVHDAKQVAKVLSRYVNSCGPTAAAALVDEIQKDHRTLQQKLFGVMVACIKEWANGGTYGHDLRTEWTVDRCRDMMTTFGDMPTQPPLI